MPIPLIAGPGALTSAVLLMGESAGNVPRTLGVLGVLAAVLLLTLLVLLLSVKVGKLLGVTGTNVIGRVMGIVLAALAVQFVLDGVLEVFPPA